MLSEEDFKNKHLQHPISFLTEKNLDKLETHCRKAIKFERGVEHKVVLELLDRYYQYQKEIQDKNNKITKLQKENEEKDKQIDLMADTLQDNLYLTPLDGLNKEEIKQYFEKLSKEKEGVKDE